MVQSIVSMQSTVPHEMTIAEWRRLRVAHTRSRPNARCDHFHESTTRYDHEHKVLTFLLVCPVCGTEKVLESRHYEPRFDPAPARHGASIHRLPIRENDQAIRRAA